MATDMSEEPVQTPAHTESSEAVLRLLTQMVEDAPNLQAIAVGYVRKDGAAAVRYTPMSTAMLSHLSRIFDLKIDREYMASMFPQATPVRPPSIDKSRLGEVVRSHLAAKREGRPSPAEKLQEREKARNRSKVRKAPQP